MAGGGRTISAEGFGEDVLELEAFVSLLDDPERFTPPGPQEAITSLLAEYGGAGAGGTEDVVRAFAGALAVCRLEKQKYKKASGDGGAESLTECAICLEEFEVGDDLRAMPCPSSHRFHKKCLAQWLPRKRSCPLCRHPLQPCSPSILRFLKRMVRRHINDG